MKIIISENQELKAKKKIAFFLLDKQKYNLIDIDDDDGTIYFVKNIGDEKSEIRFDKSDGGCYTSYDLISFLSTLTGFEEYEVQELIGNWVEHALQMEVKYNLSLFDLLNETVEHALQMEVKYNTYLKGYSKEMLNIPYN